MIDKPHVQTHWCLTGAANVANDGTEFLGALRVHHSEKQPAFARDSLAKNNYFFTLKDSVLIKTGRGEY